MIEQRLNSISWALELLRSRFDVLTAKGTIAVPVNIMKSLRNNYLKPVMQALHDLITKGVPDERCERPDKRNAGP